MKLSDRERVLVLVAPMGLVFLVYAFWFNYSYRQKMQTADRDYAAAVAGQVREWEVPAEMKKKAQLEEEVRKQERTKADLERQAAEICGRSFDSLQRIQAEQRLTELFLRHRLELIEAAPANKDGQAKLPNSLTEALGRLGPASHSKTGQVRCLRLVGPFMDVLAAVRELSETEDSPAIPISLTMAEADVTANQRQWTLFIWM